jgi:pimeloyl-ACP methyl ester carboxylesterase
VREVFAAAAIGSVAPTRVILMPGAYQTPEDFLHAGFWAAMRARQIAADLSLVELEAQDLTDRRPLTELRERLVLPARAQGCRRIYLGGISLGAFVALDYASRHADEVDDLCLIAPYLGNRMLTAEIADAGGLRAWCGRLPVGSLAESEEERRIWRFLGSRADSGPDLYLAYGREDRFARAQGLLAATLPPSRVDVVPGAHDWDTWRTLWENFLDKGFR